jgi:hypothetical protein
VDLPVHARFFLLHDGTERKSAKRPFADIYPSPVILKMFWTTQNGQDGDAASLNIHSPPALEADFASVK